MKIFNKSMIVSLFILVLLYLLVGYAPLPFPKVYGYVIYAVLSIMFIAYMWHRIVKEFARP